MPKMPSSLHSLAIKGSDIFLASPLNVEIPQVLAARLLTQLNLVDCAVRCLSGVLADCLQGLTSLSLRQSTVYEDNGFAVTQLTNLVQLDLAHAAWLVDGRCLNLKSFPGWPLLRIRNICEGFAPRSLFCTIQVLDVSLVHEIYASCLTPGMMGAKIHLLNMERHTRSKLIADMLSLPFSALLVEVRIGLPANTLASEASEAVGSCVHLQVLANFAA